MAELLRCQKEGWNFGGHGQRGWQGRDWTPRSRTVGAGNKGLEMGG